MRHATVRWLFFLGEIQGLPINSANQDVVSRATERALLHPRAPKVLVRRGGSMQIEVNMGDEVLVLYKDNKVDLISAQALQPSALNAKAKALGPSYNIYPSGI